MKLKVLSLAILGMSLSSAHAALPAAWMNADLDADLESPTAGSAPWFSWGSTESKGKGEAGQDFDRYFDATNTLANTTSFERSKKGRRPWYLQSIKAELGVEASGQIGFLGLEGEAAVELIWTRTRESVAELIGKKAESVPFANLLEEEDAPAELDSSMGPADLEREARELTESLSGNPKIRDTRRLRSELLAHFQRIQPAVLALANSPEEWSWKPYKLQLELFVQAEGSVLPVLTVGAVTRIRLEWSIIRKKTNAPATRSVAGFSGLLEKLEQLNSTAQKNATYPLVAFKAGIGFASEVELGIAELKGHAIGSVFFKKVKKVVPAPGGSAQPLALVTATGAQELPMEGLMKGLEKGWAISQKVLARAERSEQAKLAAGTKRQFELAAIEVELALGVNGGFFLPSVDKLAAVELFFSKKGSL